jgi:NAD(P)-dependent dehydrogenase (short-subunit alcohol dehydrogenase family)
MAFLLTNKIVVITGGAGFLGSQFCASVADAGGVAVVADIDVETKLQQNIRGGLRRYCWILPASIQSSR